MVNNPTCAEKPSATVIATKSAASFYGTKPPARKPLVRKLNYENSYERSFDGDQKSNGGGYANRSYQESWYPKNRPYGERPRTYSNYGSSQRNLPTFRRGFPLENKLDSKGLPLKSAAYYNSKEDRKPYAEYTKRGRKFNGQSNGKQIEDNYCEL